MKMKLIGLDNLPDEFRIWLEDSFRLETFRKALEMKGSAKSLREELKCNRTTLQQIRNGKISIKVETLKKLSCITKIPLEEIETHTARLKTRDNSKNLEIKLPVEASPQLASLVGHCMGDGHLDNRQFSFFNQSHELVDEVIANVRIAFGTNVIPVVFNKSGGWEVEFPTCIARLMKLIGAPNGNKVNRDFQIPKWIMNGSKEIKIAFIRALFDDEGWVKTKFIRRSKSTQRMIGINMSKNEELLDGHKMFLNQIRKLLLEFNVKPAKVTKIGKTKNSISMGFIISNLENLNNFLTNIGFTDTCKREKLTECLNTSKVFNSLQFQQSISKK